MTLSWLPRRGYFGIVFYEPKYKENLGTAIRSAHCFGASFIGLIGARFRPQRTDTNASHRHLPIYEYKDYNDFIRSIPINCELVGIEVDGQCNLRGFFHPERAVYIIGGEDRSIPIEIKTRVQFDSKHCLNMAVAASIVMYDRSIK